jgi:hypothetical protein
MEFLGESGRAPVAGSVRYGSGDTSVLRLVLYRLWGLRCYRCHRPKDFNDIQIDHIIPRHTSPERLAELVLQYGLPGDFDIDAPGNLAPICSVCNGPRVKGMKEYRARLLEQDQLDRALALQPQVAEQVTSFGRPGKIAEHLLRASEADLSHPGSRRAFEEHAPAVVQKLALLDAAKVDFTSFSTAAVEVGEGTGLEVGISLGRRGRVAAAFLTDICGCSVANVLTGPVAELLGKIRANTQSAFERANVRGGGPTVSGPPEIGYIRIDVGHVGYIRSWPGVKFSFEGGFEADLSASLVQDGSDGIGLREIQGDAQVYGMFSFEATWNPSGDHGDMDISGCLIEWWKDDIQLHDTSAP